MGKINREELYKILDRQYQKCKSSITNSIDFDMDKLEELKGDIIDIKTEISMGNTLEGGSLFKSVDEDYYDKQKLLSSESVLKEGIEKISLDKLFWPEEYGDKQSSVTAPKQHKKKYLIKLSNKIPPTVVDEIAKDIDEKQFIVYNQDTIEQIITLDVE